MKIDITDDQMRTLFSEAVYASMGDEGRAELVKGAIESLLERKTVKVSGGYRSRETSELQEAFSRALRFECDKIVREMLQNDKAIRTQLEGIVRDAWLQLMTPGDNVEEDPENGIPADATRAHLVNRVSEGIALGLTRKERNEW